jgi:hypothetical protein
MERRMKGFDPKFENFPDYINGITYEIWEEESGVEKLYEYYASDIVVRSPLSLIIGNESVIAATKATLLEFPDRKLFGEDVIWSGSPEEGMLSSHRIISTATHLGDGQFGKATGKKLTYRVIADCHAINNQINDEWLVRDCGAMVRQMGWTPENFARQEIDHEGGPDNCTKPFSPSIDQPGPYKGKGNENEWGIKYSDILNRIMNSDISVIHKEYDRACQLEYPSGITGHTCLDAELFWTGLRSSLPSASFEIEHQIGRDDPMMPPRVALRWTLKGKHDGLGLFGEPTGAELYLMGISHAEFGPWGLRREYVVFDETAIWKQIILKKG